MRKIAGDQDMAGKIPLGCTVIEKNVSDLLVMRKERCEIIDDVIIRTDHGVQAAVAFT